MCVIDNIAFVVHVLTSFFLLGLIWFVQVVHYPLFRKVKTETPDYFIAHQRLTGFVVMLPMVLQLGTAIRFLRFPVPYVSPQVTLANLILILLVWVLTFTVLVPQHRKLARAYDVRAVDILVRANFARTLLWTAQSALVVYMLL